MASFLGGLKNFFNGNGILGSSKATDIFFPKNPLISDYGIGGKGGQNFTVKIAAYKQPEITISKETKGTTVTANTSPHSLGEFEILYAPSSLTLSHSHNFGNNNIITKGLKMLDSGSKVFGLGGGDVLSVMQSANQLATKKEDGGGSTTFKNAWNTFGALDMAKAYEGTSIPSFNLNFSLVAHTDPLLDVVIPATYLTYLTYPKISSGNKNVSDILDMIGQNASSILNTAQGILGNSSKTSETQDKSANAADKSKKELNKFSDMVKEATVGKWRYLVGDAPPFWTLSTSNGVFGMVNASVTNITVEYHGPWIKSPTSNTTDSLKNAISNMGGSSIGFDPTKIFGDSVTGGIGAEDVLGDLFSSDPQMKGYPSYANVSLTFENNYSQMFGEELLAFLDGGKKVKTGVKGL
jgi:hypothetical protein